MSLFRRAGSALKSAITGQKAPRTREAFARMYQDAGFIPLFNIDDLEARRQRIKEILGKFKVNLFNPESGGAVAKAQVIQDTFDLFYTEGDPWYRGIEDGLGGWLSSKVNDFIANCMEAGYLTCFWADLFEEAMTLLHLSFKQLDVTNTPPYIIESRPIVTPQLGKGAPERRVDMASIMELQRVINTQQEEIERLKTLVPQK